MISIRNEKTTDVAARERLLDVAYGRVRFRKPSEQIRRGRLAADGLSLIATESRAGAPDGALGRMVGTVRLWHVETDEGTKALLLGPLAVHPDYRCKGLGAQLMERAIRNARMRGHKAVLLVGDPEYYSRFGFSAEKTGKLVMPGDCAAHRVLALELVEGALDGASGSVLAAGKPVSSRRPRFAPTIAVEDFAAVSHAA